jgi:ABC-2 type transport system ATP-binding protein
MSIEVKNITKIYGTQKALNDVSFTIDSGEIVGFLGPNGAGKSTMMKIITGFIPPTNGVVKINGVDVLESTVDIRRDIGYLPENNPLYLEMFVKEYLNFTAGIYKLGKHTKTRIDEIIEITGLTKEFQKKIGALSKGFRQRVGLAQALIHNPSILILDEPTSGLDPNQIIEIRNLIKKIGTEKTVMLSTHIMQEVEAICSRTIIINKGEIVANDLTSKINQHSAETSITVVVEFNSPVKEPELKMILGVTRVKKIDEKNWLIQSNKETDVRTEVFNFAVKKGIAVLSLQKKEKRLEDVFHELTTN